MNQEQQIPNSRKFRAYLVLFAVNACQTGIGLTLFERFVYRYAKQDGWISIILAGLFTHITMYVIIKTLQRYKDKDLYDIHRSLFGKWIGTTINGIFIIYCFYMILVVTVTYYEIIKTYLFPEIPNWFVSAMLLVLTIYTIVGGIRVVIGLCFFSVALFFPVLFVLYQVFPYLDLQNFFPMFEANPGQLFKAIYKLAFSLAGFEVIYFYYPYILDKEKAMRYGQIGIFITNSFFLYFMLLAIGLFSGAEMTKSVWPTLNMYKLVKFPFLEQYQVIVLCIFMLGIIPIITLYMWSLTKGIKKHVPITQKKALYIASTIVLIVSLLYKTRAEVEQMSTFFSKGVFFIVFVYPYVLFFASFIIEKIKQKKKKEKPAAL
ncbi:GerAB/ArcD/ProY family transporter [Microbacteriaceae bacterium 4G12]